jgi:peptidoglycan LD-endopeptidase LytH
MPGMRNAIVMCALLAACSTNEVATEATLPATVPQVATTRVVATTSAPTTTEQAATTTRPKPLHYVFPFTGKKITYGRRHHDYPATDVFGCGSEVVAPIGGAISETRLVDPWEPKINDPATRGGKYVSMIGDDGVRYYFAHLDSVAVHPGNSVDAGQLLGVMGQTGNARNSACHTHFGISWPCDETEWEVRRGEIWPWRYLDAWRNGGQLSPVDEIDASEAASPDACSLAALAPSAADA